MSALKALDITVTSVAERIWYLQHAAYRIESSWIGEKYAPPLTDTVERLRRCKETFIGYELEQEIIGAVSYVRDEDEVVICRLMVQPEYFRQGIATALMKYLIATECAKCYKVSASANNLPAQQLYNNLGFSKQGETEMLPGVVLTHFEKTGEL